MRYCKVFIVLLVVVFFSCSKEKTTYNKLEGAWLMNSIMDQDSTLDFNEADTIQTWVFNICQNYEESCSGYIQEYDGNINTFWHNLNSSGDQITIIDSQQTVLTSIDEDFNITAIDTIIVDTTIYDIIKLNAKELALRYTNSDNNIINITFDKVVD